MSVPVYWYSDFWLQQIYELGVDSCATASMHDKHLLHRFCGREKTITMKGDGRLFFWVPKVTVLSFDEDGFHESRTNTLRLYAKVEENSDDFRAIIDVVREGGHDKMIACRRFRTGDSITFLSSVEERKKMIFVGGSLARKSEIPEESNAYVTAGRMLRCSKPVEEGEEIVISETRTEYADYLNRIDRLVVTRTMQFGRISPDGADVKDSVVVDFANGTSEVVGMHAGLGFVYRD